MKHLIKKQVIDLTIINKKDAFRLQQLVSEHYWKEIARVLERAFDEVPGEEGIFRIDRLEIDLGRLTEKDIEKGRWADILYEKITDQLRLLKKGVVPGVKTLVQSRADNISEQWLFYMEKGHLPWNVLQAGKAWYDKILEVFATDSTAINKLRKLILEKNNVAQRIAFQHSEDFLVSLAEALTAKTQKKLPAAIDELLRLFVLLERKSKKRSLTGTTQLRAQLWQQSVLYAASNKQQATPESFVEMVLSSDLPGDEPLPDLSPAFLKKNKMIAGILQQIKKEQLNENNGLKKEKEKEEIKGKKPNNIINKDTPDRLQEQKPVRPQTENDRLLPEVTDNSEVLFSIQADADGIFVQHAGMVLLHPFLVHFFRNLKLLDENRFRDDDAHQKGLLLLYFLATGNTIAAEHELVMAKVLCGYPLQRPVIGNIILSEEEMTEANDLLVNVIHHWEILKNSSAAALRESFLQRGGKLSITDEKASLLVERSSIDILLDDLPWNISMIHLPWNKDLIRVEW